MPTITVIGSLNTDMITVTSRVPEGGETLQAQSFNVGWGGKGANQAVAAARLSKLSSSDSSITKVHMIGAVGEDVFGPQLLKSLEDDGIDVRGVKKLQGEKTGTAVILVEKDTGENRILFTPGANFSLSVTDELVQDDEYGDVAIFQLETPLDVVIHNIKKAQAGGTRIILNPAPAAELPKSLYPEITHLILNESEAAILSGLPKNAFSSSSDLDALAADFIGRGVANFILTLGAEGAFYQTVTRLRKKQPGKRVPAAKAKVVDTTAAGDTFVGAYAVRIAAALSESAVHEGEVIDNAVAFAIRAAAKTVEKAGAQKSIPWLDEVSES